MSASELPGGVTEVRVRYSETDCGGVVYHSNYLKYFEQGRTELMRSLGAPYRKFEEEDRVILVVVDAQLRFRRPAHYDDLLRIETELTRNSGARLTFGYRVLRADPEGGSATLLCEGSTVLGCISAESGRPRRLPERWDRLLGGESRSQ